MRAWPIKSARTRPGGGGVDADDLEGKNTLPAFPLVRTRGDGKQARFGC